MTTLVLDASVAAKWVLPGAVEPLLAEANALLQGHLNHEIRGVVPDLFWPEVANVLWKAARQGRMLSSDAATALNQLQQFGLTTRPSRDITADALALSLRFERSAYDMVYAALALHLGADVVTADERLVRTVGTRLPVRWLGTV